MSRAQRTLCVGTACRRLILTILALLSCAAAQAEAQTFIASVGTATHYFTQTCGGPNATRFGDLGPFHLHPELPLIKVDGTWVPDSITTSGPPSPGGGGQSTFTSTLSASGVVTSTERGTYIQNNVTGVITANATLNLETGEWTWCREITYGGVFPDDKQYRRAHFQHITLRQFLDTRAADPVADDRGASLGALRFFPDGTASVMDAALDRTLPLRRGVVADGVSLLLLRVRSNVAVTFSIAASGNDGALLPVTANVADPPMPGGTLTAVPRASPSGSFAWALYRAPAQFRGGTLPSRTIVVGITPNGAMAGSLSLTLERPPVVLIHGAWDDPSVWTSQPSSFKTSLDVRGFRTSTVSYKVYNASSWHPSNDHNGAVRSLQSGIANALTAARLQRQLAATVVDVVGHSTGGLVARALVAQPPCGPARRFQCNVDPANLKRGWIRHLITLGTPHLGAPVAKFLIENMDRPMPPLSSLREFMAATGRPIDRGLVHDFIPGSDAFAKLGSTCDDPAAPVRGYGIVGDHFPAPVPSTFDLVARHFLRQGLDEYFGGPNDVMSGVASQWGRGNSPGPIPAFANTVHSDSYVVAGVVAEPRNLQIQARVAQLLDLPSGHPDFQCFTPAPPPDNSQSVGSASDEGRSFSEPSDTTRGIRLTSPVAGSVITHANGSMLTLTAEPFGGAAPQSLIFIVGNSLTVAGPTSPPFQATVPIPLSLPLGGVSVAVMALDSVTGDLVADLVSVTIAPPGEPLAIVAEPQSWVFPSTRHPPASLRVLATYNRGGGSTAQIEVPNATSGLTYTALKGDAVVRVSADGLVTPIAAGTDTVQVRYNGRMASLSVVVHGNAPFLDAQLISGTTPIRAVHVTELRERLAPLRAEAGLEPYSYADPTLSPAASVIRAQHIADLRAAIEETYTALGLAAPGFTDSEMRRGLLIRLVHVEELRAAVSALE